MANIGIVGPGRWGTALSIFLVKLGHKVILVGLPEEISLLKSNRENKKFLPGYLLPPELLLKTEVNKSDSLNLLIFAVPGIALLEAAKIYLAGLDEDIIVASTIKALYIDRKNQLILPTDKIANYTQNSVVQLAAAAFPENLLAPNNRQNQEQEGDPVIGTVAGDKVSCNKIQNIFQGSTLRLYTDDDVLGLCFGSAAKNVIAIAAGITDTLGYGDSTFGALVSRGAYEIAQLGQKLGGKPTTFGYGSTFLADLVATTTSILSRNRNFGFFIGQGKTLTEAKNLCGGVVEGINTTKVICRLAKYYETECPISDVVKQILDKKISPQVSVRLLLNRPPKSIL